MKPSYSFLFYLLVIGICCSCEDLTNDLPSIDPPSGEEGSGDDNPGGNSGGGSSSTVDLEALSSFSVVLNPSALEETEVIPSSETDPFYNSYIENNFSQKNVTTLNFDSNGEATASGVVKGDTVDIDKGRVVVRAHSKGLVVQVSGTTTDGSIKIYSEKKFSLKLDNATINNPDGSAINIQSGNCFVVLNGSNTLSDGASATYTHPETEDMKAVFFSEDDLRFSGTGSLTIMANNAVGKAGISCDDEIFVRPNTNIQITAKESAGNGMKSNDAIVIKGGVLNIQTAAKGTKGISSDGYVQIDGGRTSIITTGGVDTSDASDPTGCAAIKSDSVLYVNGGELYLKSTGQGGKGISADDTIRINGGNIYVITEGSQYGTSNSMSGPGGGGGRPGGWGGSNNSSSDNSVSPKGIRCDKDIYISGGNILVRTSGTNAEGIESKATLSFSGGNTAAMAYDDGFNAKDILISGGKALAISSGEGDGMDSNGSIKATGGVLIGVSSNVSSEDGIDCESGLTISNATVIGLCRGGMGIRVSGRYVSTKITGSSGDYVALSSGTKPLVAFKLIRDYSSGNLLISTPELTSGSYTLQTGVTPEGGTLWMNYLENCTSVSGGKSTTVTAK